jgi:hypothetical protein
MSNDEGMTKSETLIGLVVGLPKFAHSSLGFLSSFIIVI